MNKHFDTDKINEISFTDVLDHLNIEYKHVGTTYRTLCPWHDDSTPSLAIYQSTNENHCHCFACGNGGSVIDYVMAHEHMNFKEAAEMLSNEFCIMSCTNHYVSKSPSCASGPLPTGESGERGHLPSCASGPLPTGESGERGHLSYLPPDIVFVSIASSFCKMLCLLYPLDDVARVVEQYRLGCYNYSMQYDDDVMFASIDSQGRVHNVKLQSYDCNPHSATFTHCRHDHILWLGSLLKKNGTLPADAVFDNNCLFGAHLLNEHPSAQVVLVESPKNAVIGALEMPDYVWVAAGSKSMLNRKALECLRNRNVAVFPDRDAVSDWQNALGGMRDITNFHVSDFCAQERIAGDNMKFDIADYYLARRRHPSPNT